MALNNIISPKQQQLNSQGQPLAGGFVFLYEPGTTTFITSFTASDLITPHTNPVRLSGSGRADIWITRDCDVVVTDRLGNGIYTQDNANPDALGGDDTGGLVANGSFEIETTPPVPDGWLPVNEAGSTNAVDSAESTDGANSYRFTSSGVGGGSLTTVDFFPVNDVDNLRVNFDLFSTLATVLNIVRVEWYDVTFISISNSDVYSSTANPLAWTEFQLVATPPANARFAKLRLIGIDPSVPLAGSTYFDRINVFYPAVVSGIFDNITIQNNEIISTNLNGEISMKPNGTGPFIVERNGLLAFATGDSLVGVYSPSNGNPVTPDAIAVDLSLLSQDGNTYAALQIGAGDPGDLSLRNFATGGGFSITLNNTTGGAVDAINAGDGGVFLRDPNNDESRLSVRDASVDDVHIYIAGQLNNDPAPTGLGGLQDAGIYLVNQSDALAGLLGFDESGGVDLQIANYVEQGLLSLAVRGTPASFRTAIECDPLAGVTLYHVSTGIATARTILAGNGGLEVENLATGPGGFERVLTESDSNASLFSIQGVDQAVNNSTTLVDSNVEITGIPGGRYRVEGVFQVRDVAVSGCGVRVNIATVSVSSEANVMRMSNKTFAGAGTPTADLQGIINTAFTFTALSTGSATDEIWVSGFMECFTNAELKVQFAQAVAQVGDVDFEENSWLSVTRIGSN